ncbi:hypothetical protein BKE30_14495 [Alkanindiges hydrocarboniclasticus]|uniref:Uncharacterized protein n=1 Tax=Alkanindiges hydrocarboniclasticus TaxID=1907941 RepID=A0A1S8CSW0_9GAMM|nr:hypothetical protein BKE30_14495 [Alkanindiges hydrocarboniclasticus]
MDGVVTPVQVLIVIVPKNNLLEVKAFISNKDNIIMHDGQTAEIKIENFLHSRCGMMGRSCRSRIMPLMMKNWG